MVNRFFSYNFVSRLAILYAHLRPVTLPVQSLAATAGTLLVTSSLPADS